MREVELSTGRKMPQLQLGTYRTRGKDVEIAVTSALETGYRGIDTAAVYRNHNEIAETLEKVLPRLSLSRPDIFLTSKLAPKDQGLEGCRAGVLKALKELRTDYLDLFLIHWPGVQKLPVDHPDNRRLRLESWKVMEEFYNLGVLRSIGVSNFSLLHLQDLLKNCQVVPHVNQVELHPHYPQEELVKFCNKNNIHVQAYSSLGQNGVESALLTSEPVLRISKENNITPAQVLLCWGLQRGYTVLPKSTNPEHIQENFKIDFTLSENDMTILNTLHTSETNKYAWDPANVL